MKEPTKRWSWEDEARCIICHEWFDNFPRLLVHLLSTHKHYQVLHSLLGEHRTLQFRESAWLVYGNVAVYDVVCFCNDRFRLKPALRLADFRDVANLFLDTNNTFVRHLAQAGGLENHLETVKAEIRMNRVAGSLP